MEYLLAGQCSLHLLLLQKRVPDITAVIMNPRLNEPVL